MMSEYFNTESAIVGNPDENVHDVILQGLDQSLEYGGQSVFYPVDVFKEHLNAWNGIDAVYVPSGQHIPTAEYNADPEAALKKFKGKRVGTFLNSQVLTAGQARLQSQVHITDDEIEQAIQAGNIRVSSAFNAAGKDSIQSPILPSYVLLFPKSSANPRDKTSMFLNNHDPSEDTDMTEEAVKIANLERDLKEEQVTVERLNTEMSDKTEKIEDLTGTIERLNSEGQKKDEKIASLEEQVKEYMNTEADRQWNALKVSRIPKGLVATEEAETSLRELYNTDKDAFYGKIMDVGRPAETDAEGVEFMNNEGSNPDRELAKMGYNLI